MINNSGLNIAIIEDDAFYSTILALQLKNRIIANTQVFNDGEAFLKSDIYAFDIIILDMNLTTEVEESLNGKDVLQLLVNKKAPAKVIVLSSQHVIEDAIEVLKIGAIDYIVKNEEAFDKLIGTLQSIVEFNKLSCDIKNHNEKKFTIRKSLVLKGCLLCIIIAILWNLRKQQEVIILSQRISTLSVIH